MTGERARGAVLYATAGALVAGGAAWWLVSAPPDPGNDQVDRWRAAVEQALPDTENQLDADTLPLSAGAEHPFVSPVETDEYLVSVVCRGGPDTYVRVSLSQSGSESGLGLRCSDERRPDSFRVGLADELRLYVVVGDRGPVVFRYSLQRIAG